MGFEHKKAPWYDMSVQSLQAKRTTITIPGGYLNEL
jgi:hypothetical protein